MRKVLGGADQKPKRNSFVGGDELIMKHTRLRGLGGTLKQGKLNSYIGNKCNINRCGRGKEVVMKSMVLRIGDPMPSSEHLRRIGILPPQPVNLSPEDSRCRILAR